jgi:hypothetical protein
VFIKVVDEPFIPLHDLDAGHQKVISHWLPSDDTLSEISDMAFEELDVDTLLLSSDTYSQSQQTYNVESSVCSASSSSSFPQAGMGFLHHNAPAASLMKVCWFVIHLITTLRLVSVMQHV